MQIALELSSEAAQLNAQIQESALKIVKSLSAEQEGASIRSGVNLFDLQMFRGKFLLIKENNLTLWNGDERLLTYEPGDALWVPKSIDGPKWSLSSSFAVIADIFDGTAIAAVAQSDLQFFWDWTNFLSLHGTFSQALVSLLAEQRSFFEPAEKMLRAGEVLIEQGTTGEEIYLLTKGSLEVFSAGVKVSEVTEGDLFGALGGLTGKPRTATVCAKTDSVVQLVNREQFVELIRAHPKVLSMLVERFSAIIEELNEELVEKTLLQFDNLKLS